MKKLPAKDVAEIALRMSPYDPALFIECLEDFHKHLLALLAFVNFADMEGVSSATLIDQDSIQSLQRKVRRLRAFLCDGQVELLFCRNRICTCLGELWEILLPVFRLIDAATVGDALTQFVEVRQLDRLRDLSSCLREFDSVLYCTHEDMMAGISPQARQIAQSLGYTCLSDYSAVVLAEAKLLGIGSQEYEEMVVLTGGYPLVAFFDRTAEADSQHECQLETIGADQDFSVSIKCNRVRIGEVVFEVNETTAHYLDVMRKHPNRWLSDAEAVDLSPYLSQFMAKRKRFDALRAALRKKTPEIARWLETKSNKGTMFRRPN